MHQGIVNALRRPRPNGPRLNSALRITIRAARAEQDLSRACGGFGVEHLVRAVARNARRSRPRLISARIRRMCSMTAAKLTETGPVFTSRRVSDYAIRPDGDG